MMKSMALLLGALLTLVLLAGCAKKAVEYAPKDEAETAILQFVKQKVPNLVVIKITPPQRMPGMPPNAPLLMPYTVDLATPNDDSMRTMTGVMYDDKTKKIGEASFLMPPPVSKFKAKK